MSQDFTSQDLTAGGNGGSFNTTTGYATGATVPFSGTFRCSNKYMDIVMALAVGEIFLPGPDGKKTTWYALTATLSTNKDGGFSSLKVAPGAA
jgi:Trk-type K+ transport system membrane component